MPFPSRFCGVRFRLEDQWMHQLIYTILYFMPDKLQENIFQVLSWPKQTWLGEINLVHCQLKLVLLESDKNIEIPPSQARYLSFIPGSSSNSLDPDQSMGIGVVVNPSQLLSAASSFSHFCLHATSALHGLQLHSGFRSAERNLGYW